MYLTTETNNIKYCGACKDSYDYCAWIGKSECGSEMMVKQCRKFCGFCGDECKDNDSLCTQWAKQGFCQDLDDVRSECKKSCKLC